MQRLAVLYVIEGGVYYTKYRGLDLWPKDRDARGYKGPMAAICHPPCKRWGKYWGGGPSVKVKRYKGDDEGLFFHALWVVRTFGGIVEHPKSSHAWSWFGLGRPNRWGGWTEADSFGGRSCCVEQGHYGHKARKATWLYAVNLPKYPDLIWGPAKSRMRLDEGFITAEERRRKRKAGQKPIRRLTPIESASTPSEFADLLISLVRGSK